ncbi:Mitogen-activated protein kinase kinase kinase 1 [Perkinsus olseni]|uniref:Mitogen-activated protein kinase kinase kinase 1 n=1 Tax=Perkinsus olseni TaxID=32597 RepID=A0A7J6SZE5_PEROL|nr:Mitogen-activated protein kinase kinase kinase 1 [Perkinsus olseni]
MPHPYVSDEGHRLGPLRRSPRRSSSFHGRSGRSDSESFSPARKAALGTSRSKPTSLMAEFGQYCSGAHVYGSQPSGGSPVGYSLTHLLAQGSEGDVYQAASRRDTSQRLCIKIVKLRSAAVRRHARQELAVLFGLMKRQEEGRGADAPSSLGHLVQASDWFLSPSQQELGIVMERCDFCLDDFICVLNATSERLSRDQGLRNSVANSVEGGMNVQQWRVRLHPKEMLRIFTHACRAMDYLHNNMVVHCDVKLDNLVYHSASRSWKLCDFGSSRSIPEGWEGIKSSDRLVGTLWTAAPEVIRYGYISPACDVWSLGCVLWECGYLERPFNSRVLLAYQNKSIDVLEGPMRRPGGPSWIHSKQLLLLLREGMLVQDPELRPDCARLLSTEFLPTKLSKGFLTITADDFSAVWYVDRSIFTNTVVLRLVERLRSMTE